MRAINILIDRRVRHLLLMTVVILMMSACKKGWLDAKPDKSLVIPKSIKDYQALLDNTSASSVSSGQIPFNVSQPGLDEIGAGDFYLDDPSKITTPYHLAAYKWQTDIYEGSTDGISDWNIPYARVLVTNIILEGIADIIPQDNFEQVAWNRVKGSALFLRAYSHYNVASLFCKPFDVSSAATDLGIPLRLTSNFNEPSVRSTVQQTYDQILKDLKESVNFLPESAPNNVFPADAINKCRPNKASAYAMLARVYLSMSIYDSAFSYADKSLKLYDVLMDYKSTTIPTSQFIATLSPNMTATTTITRLNPEVLFQMTLNNNAVYGTTGTQAGNMDSVLRKSYEDNDHRKVLFVKPTATYLFRGSYDGALRFSGLATDETYLIRAECFARKNDTASAMADLNKLLRNRYKTGFVNKKCVDAEDALRQILTERRKELCFRGIRWTDLRRLNKESKFAVTLNRNGIYSLPPNDPRYVYPIPNNVIILTGMEQNPR